MHSSSGEASGNASDLKVLRVVRCLRLIKLVRLAKASTTLHKFVRKYGIRNSALTLMKFGIAVVIVSHWMSCLWMLIPKLEGGTVNWATKVKTTIYLLIIHMSVLLFAVLWCRERRCYLRTTSKTLLDVLLLGNHDVNDDRVSTLPELMCIQYHVYSLLRVCVKALLEKAFFP